MKQGWETKQLDSLYQIGSSKRVLKSQWRSSGIPFYRGREVTRLAADGFVENELFISEDHFSELSQKHGVPKAGDIVITAIGTIGNSHVVRSSDQFYFKDASVLWMKRAAEVSSEFVNLWLKSPDFFDQLDRGNGATVDTLTIQKLQSVEIPVPPLPAPRPAPPHSPPRPSPSLCPSPKFCPSPIFSPSLNRIYIYIYIYI